MACRLLYVVGQLGAGGLERQLTYLLETLDRERYRPEVAVWGLREEDRYVAPLRALGIPLHPIANGGSGLDKLQALRRLVRERQPEVVHSYSFWTNFPVWRATWGTSILPIGSIRLDFVNERKNMGPILGNLSARFPPTQICNSLEAKRAADRATGPFKPRQTYLVRNGLDIRRFASQPPPPNGEPILLALGRLSPQKRWDRLLEAVGRAAESGIAFTVQLAGTGPLLPELQAQTARMGLEKRIQFLGARNDIPALLANAAFLVHTADYEGCPNVVMEAMAAGRAVVATDAGDTPHLVEDGRTGFVVKRGDPALLAARIAALLKDRELCRRMGEAGRVKAEQEFGLERLAAETLAVYRTAGWGGTR